MEKNNQKKRDRMYKGVIVFITLMVLLTIGAVGYGAYKYKSMIDGWHQPWDSSSDQQNTEDNKGKDKENNKLKPFTILIAGVDSRGEEQSRSDTIMLATVDPIEESVLLFSIPRDTYVEIPGYGYDKFNHAMFYGGPQLVKETVEGFLNVDVDHYVTIDFEGFRRIIDELGGVDVNIKKRMVYYDPTDGTSIDLKPGQQTLDGKNALDYARYRMSSIGPSDTDFERIERQHEVIKAIIQEGKQFTTIFKIFSLMEILGEHVKTDMTEEEIRSLYTTFYDFSSEKLVTEDVYGTNKRIESHNLRLWFYVVEKQERERLRQLIESYLKSE